jgi:hypothetical protein
MSCDVGGKTDTYHPVLIRTIVPLPIRRDHGPQLLGKASKVPQVCNNDDKPLSCSMLQSTLYGTVT